MRRAIGTVVTTGVIALFEFLGIKGQSPSGGLVVPLVVAAVGGGCLYLALTSRRAVSRFPLLGRIPGAWKPGPPTTPPSTGISTSDQARVTTKRGSVRGFDKGIDARDQSEVETDDTDIEKDSDEGA
jgi:hypothetical protein